MADIEALASAEQWFDVDGFSATFRGAAQLDALAGKLGGARHALDHQAPENANHRMLFDEERYAFGGLASPRQGVGDGYAIERNRCAPARPAPSRPAPPRPAPPAAPPEP